MLKLSEHTSRAYGPRTRHNAKSAGLTVALAADLGTAGERLTHTEAGLKYLGFQFDTELMENDFFLFDTASRIARYAQYNKVNVINIAGNGIYTLNLHGITQRDVNLLVYRVLSQALIEAEGGIKSLVSGGQTGVDIAAAVFCEATGFDGVITFPKGFIQRGLDKIDQEHNPKQIELQVKAWAQELKEDLKDRGLVLHMLSHLQGGAHQKNPLDTSHAPNEEVKDKTVKVLSQSEAKDEKDITSNALNAEKNEDFNLSVVSHLAQESKEGKKKPEETPIQTRSAPRPKGYNFGWMKK